MAGSMIEQIITFAVDKEREAAAFYELLAGRVIVPAMRDAALLMADEERKHEKLLRGLTPKAYELLGPPSLPDMKISDYMVGPSPSADMNYAELLATGMKREQKAYALYSDLEARAPDEATRRLFTLLKGEELRHKSRLEREYQDHVLREG